MHNDEEFDQEKTLTLTKNELIFLSDSVTLTLEHYNENGRVHIPARQLMPSAKVPVPIELIHTIGMGLLIASAPKNNTQTIEKIKKTKAKNKKFSLLYFKIMSLFNLINS